MANNHNQCNFIGRIAKDIELRSSPSGMVIINFTLAVGSDYKKDGEKIERTSWVQCRAFGKTAEIINQYTGKGSKLLISSAFVTDSYEDNQGQRKYVNYFRVNEFEFLDSKTDGAPAQQAKPQQARQPNPEPPMVFDDDIPF